MKSVLLAMGAAAARAGCAYTPYPGYYPDYQTYPAYSTYPTYPGVAVRPSQAASQPVPGDAGAATDPVAKVPPPLDSDGGTYAYPYAYPYPYGYPA